MEEILKSFILGVVQGLTEFLPISSTGHLVLGRKLLGLEEAGLLLDTMLHFGTVLAVMLVFWQDILEIVKRPLSKLTLLLIVGTIPTAVIGLLFNDFFEEISVTGATIGWEFLLTGLILWMADRVKKQGYKHMEDITYRDALLVGTLQGAAILPAISRSGLTIAGSLYVRIHKEDAARFSFLLSIPSILGANVFLSIKKLTETGSETVQIGFISLCIGTFAALLSGYVAVRWMLRILQKGSLQLFSIYVWLLGLGIIIAQIMGKW